MRKMLSSIVLAVLLFGCRPPMYSYAEEQMSLVR